MLQDLKERFLWIANVGYFVLVLAGVVGLIYPQYTFHLGWSLLILFGVYKISKNPVKQAIKLEEMVVVRKERDAKS